MLKILKASAGSGKTFNLAKEYITLLLKGQGAGMRPDPSAYKHILAVTFTNKSTDEMKQRILEELDTLASEPEKSKYLADLKTLTGCGVEDISTWSKLALSHILNDYSAFSVSTIDRFFQRTLKAFAREVGQFSSYQISLDRDSLVRESVDRILDSLTDKRQDLIGWLTESVEEQLLTGGRFSIEKDLYDMAISLKGEEHREMVEKYEVGEKEAYSEEKLMALRQECRMFIDNYVERVKTAAINLEKKIRECQVDPVDFKSKFMDKMLKRYTSLQLKSADDVPMLTAASKASALDPDKWFSKANDGMRLCIDGVINDDVRAFVKLFDRDYKVYMTAKLLVKQVYALRISNELNKSFDMLMKEKNVLCIDDSNVILRGIIDNCDAPFIYEKTGIWYDHFLLDEFQDTSRIQWDNFRPLIENSIASGNSNLVVGDVKQSIYRWRNSDWNLLNRELKENLSEVVEETLDSNWRSCRAVVEFNNSFYEFAASALDEEAETDGMIAGLYSDVRQKVMTIKPHSGSVNAIFCSDSQNELVAVWNEVNRLLSSGVKYSDIGIIVRKNDDGANIAKMLIDKGIPVISDDSLSVKSSPAVHRLLALLSCFCNPEDSLNSYIVSSLNIRQPESSLSISDLCEHFIRELNPQGEIPYLMAFMDVVQDWSQTNGNSLQEFLAYIDTADPKISSPEGTDAVRIITIHKAKGLEFPYVIFPYAEKVKFWTSSDYHWCHPDGADKELPESAGGVYRVRFSIKLGNTLFSKDFDRERKMLMVDALNVFYVATTRARYGMSIIAAMPTETDAAALKGAGRVSFKDMSKVLYRYMSHQASESKFSFEKTETGEEFHAVESYRLGWSCGGKENNGGKKAVKEIDMNEYLSFQRKLDFRTEVSDFFTDSGQTGIRASGRLRGIVMHDIMSRVAVPGDLGRALAESFENGSIDSVEMGEIRELLASRIESGRKRGWFPDEKGKVYMEVPIIGGDGKIHRPDRVIIDGISACVIDFKFGVPMAGYRDQVLKYANLYKAMGYVDVSAYLWYVQEDKVDKVL